LVQTQYDVAPDELFGQDYAYFSSTSKSWLAHAARYVDQISERLKLTSRSLVIEVAANDGYLLQNFVAKGIPCLGIEPTLSTAEVARQKGIPIKHTFFCEAVAQELRQEGRTADLIVGNNVYAHVPDINDFTLGLKTLLNISGTITLEFPHLMSLIKHQSCDTVYHEHYSYFSLYSVTRIFRKAGLRIWDVEALPTHGGSLRIYGCHQENERAESRTVADLLEQESSRGLHEIAGYLQFQAASDKVKDGLVRFLIDLKQRGISVGAYGAAAKGNTLLNYAGIKPDLLPYVCDAAASKQGKFMPGSHIPILSPNVLQEYKPQVVLVLPWNIAQEVVVEQSGIKRWGGRFVVAIPEIRYLD
jgi:SAM-dependent methyltransferase